MKTTQPAGLQEVVTFLCDARSYPHRPDSVELVETHASLVALAGHLVFKVKKPVDFGFLNYSTLDRRKHFCQREVELNRRLCPDGYLGVASIVRQGGRLEFAASEAADAVEYVVQMSRLDEAHFLSVMLETNQATEADLRRVLKTLGPFYQQQPALRPSAIVSVESVRQTVLGNLDMAATFAEAPRCTVTALKSFNEQFLAARSDLLDRRIRSGWIKDCHGDLRPEHIHLARERVRIYDCIEFNDALRFIDVAADVAFLSMELAFAGRWDLVLFFLAGIRDLLGDRDMPRLIDFYHSYRAVVRAKVVHLLAANSSSMEQCRRCVVQRYWQLALQFAIAGSTPTVLVVMGGIATGKSSLASALHDALGWPVYSSDRVRKELAELAIDRRADAQVRGELYAEPMTQRTYSRLIELAIQELEIHHGAILDATFGRRAYRDQLIRALTGSDRRVYFIELTTPEEVIRDRLRQRERELHSISDARLEDFDRLQACYEPPEELRSDQLMRIECLAAENEALGATLSRLVGAKLATA